MCFTDRSRLREHVFKLIFAVEFHSKEDLPLQRDFYFLYEPEEDQLEASESADSQAADQLQKTGQAESAQKDSPEEVSREERKATDVQTQVQSGEHPPAQAHPEKSKRKGTSRKGQKGKPRERLPLTEEDQLYIKDRAGSVIAVVPEIDRILNQAATSWKTTRMSKTDLAVLRLAVYEMQYDSDIPVGVAINEAVELAKKYGGPDSASFVNGILGKVAKGLTDKQEGEPKS